MCMSRELAESVQLEFLFPQWKFPPCLLVAKVRNLFLGQPTFFWMHFQNGNVKLTASYSSK